MAPVHHEPREVARAKVASRDWGDKVPPESVRGTPHAEQVAPRVLAEAVVDGAQEPGPQPGVVFGGEGGRVVWPPVCGWGRGEDFRWVLAEDGEELRARVGREDDVGYGRGVSQRGRDGEGCREDEGEARYLLWCCQYGL